MWIKKAFNNNIVLCVDQNHQEKIILGKGVGYNKKPREAVDETRIEKVFVFQDEATFALFDELTQNISQEHIELAGEIIQRGKEELSMELNDMILITLADHISYLLERMKQKTYLINPLQWEMKNIFPDEFAYSKKAVKYLRKVTGLEIPEEEAAFIAMHFVNAHLEMGNMQETVMLAKIIDEVLDIVRYYYNVDISEDGLDYNRFITHLRYFVKRQIQGEILKGDESAFLSLMKQKCPKDYKCAEKIKHYFENKYQWEITEDEILYLTLHLNRIMRKYEKLHN